MQAKKVAWSTLSCSLHRGQHGTASRHAQDESQQSNLPRAQGCDLAALPEGFPLRFTPFWLSRDVLQSGELWHQVIF